MSRKKIVIICLILVILAALEATAYYVWEKMYKDPAAVKEREKEECDMMYNQLLSDLLSRVQQYKWIVVINPTHGGSDKGNSTGDINEKDITFAIAKKIKEKNNNSDIGIYLTRETATNPTMEQRNNFIDQIQPDILIELHVNKDIQSSTFGTAVYYQSDFFHNKLTNAEFADIVEKEIVGAIEGKAIGIFDTDNERYDILSDKKIPAVSIKCGYVSNTKEGVLLSRDNYQSNFATGIVNAIDKAVEQIQ